MANWNLINHIYLHSSKWNFLRQVEDIDIQTAGRGVAGYQRALEILRQEISKRQQKESRFYNHFKVGSAIDWSNKYLIPESNNIELSLQQKILKVVNSSEMLNILSRLDAGQDFIKQQLKQLTNEEAPQAIIKIFNKFSESKAIEDCIADALITNLKPGDRAGQIKQQQSLLENFEKWLGVENLKNKDLLTSRKSKTISKIITALKRKYRDIEKTIEQSGRYLEETLKNKPYSVDPVVAVAVRNRWKEILKKEIDNDEKKGLTSAVPTYIIGAIQETGTTLSFDMALTYDDDLIGKMKSRRGKPIYLEVSNWGSDLVDRFGKDVQSKVDTRFEFKNSFGEKIEGYNIQEKNSYNDYYNDLEEIPEFKGLQDGKVGQLKLHGDIDLNTFKKQLSQISKMGGLVSNEAQLRVLTYLLVNLNVLNQDYAEIKRHGGRATKAGPGSLQGTQSLINRILSEDLSLFISDFIKTGVKKYKQKESVDFVIFKSRVLIPSSYIFQSILDSLENNTNGYISGLSTYSKLKSGFSSNYNAMVEKKYNAVNGMFDMKRNYQDSALVDAGSEAGNTAKNLIAITGVKLNFNIKNLVVGLKNRTP